MTRVWGQENVIEAAKQRFGANGRREDAVLEDSKHLVREVIFWDTVVMIKSRLRAPTNIKRRLNVCLRPIHDVSQFVPVFDFFKRHLLHGRAGNDEAVEFFFFYILERHIMLK